MSNDTDRVDFSQFPYLTTWYNKSKSDFKLAKKLARYYAQYYHDSYLQDKFDRFTRNADLYNGRWPQLEKMGSGFSINMGGETVKLDGPKLKHFPVIDRVARSISAENAMRPLKPLVVDMSSKAANQRRRNKAEVIGQYLTQNIVDPIREEQTAQYMRENGVRDIFSLSPEERQQMQSDVSKRVKEATPEDVISAINDFRTPEEKQLQIFLDYGMRKHDIKNKLDFGYENVVQFGEEYYRLHVHNDGEIHLELLNPKYLVAKGSEHDMFVEDGEFATYKQYITFPEFLSRYGKKVSRSFIKKIQEKYAMYPGGKVDDQTYPNSEIEMRMLETIRDRPELQEGLDPKSVEGQQRIGALYAGLEGDRRAHGLEETYVTFKWARKLQAVKRKVDGEIREDIFDEHYQFSPLKGDIEVREIYADEAWHAVQIEEEFVFCEPLPYQNRSLQNPFGTKLSIYGCKYNTLMGNSKNLSLIENGIPWQYKYNAQIRRIEEYEATNIGKVMVGTQNMRPDSFSWQEFYKSGRYLKFFPLNLQQEHHGNDNFLFKSVDMSNMVDIAAGLKQLDAYEHRIITSMYWNPSKLGTPSPYLTSGNNESNLQAADKQLYRYFNIHRQVIERVLNAYVNLARIAYKDNPLIKSVLLDDQSRAELDLDSDMLHHNEIGIFVVDDFTENQKIDFLRQQLLPLIQNEYGSMKDFIRIVNAKNMTEMISIAEEAERKKDARISEARKAESQNVEAEKEAKKELIDFKNQLDMMRDAANNEWKATIAKIDANKFAMQYDIDKDGINDLIRRVQEENQGRKEVARIKGEVDKYTADKEAETKILIEKLRQRNKRND